MNRIVGNTVIVDSAMGNAFILSSANMPVNIKNYHINAVTFWSSSTSGDFQLTETDTSAIILRFNGASTITTQTTSFGNRQTFENLKIPVLTAGTAWIYLA